MSQDDQTLDRKATKTAASETKLTGAEMVLAALAEHKVEHIFGYPGGTALPMYDALSQQTSVRHILVRHEQGAMHAAEGYARSTGKVGCVLVTSGPGATNTVTGLADAFADSIPLVVITGQVMSSLLGTDAFQEVDTVGITRPCTKHNCLVKSIDELPRVLHQAFHIASSGRPGPVLIDIPKDIQLTKGHYLSAAEVASDYNSGHTEKKNNEGHFNLDDEAIKKAVALMLAAERPVFYTGGGVINSGVEASEALRELVRATGFPITSTLMGLGAYPASDAQWLGMLGMHGTYEANKTMHAADLIIAVGARFDDRVTGTVKDFAPHAKKIHIDVDPSSINKIVRVDLGIAADCQQALQSMSVAWHKIAANPSAALQPWWDQIKAWRAVDSLNYKRSETVIKPQAVIQTLAALTTGKDAYFATDVGQHQMWAAQHLKLEKPNHLMTSGGLGTMGYGLPAAIGVQMAHPESLVVCISGDGSIQMNIQEMATATQEGLAIKVIVINNKQLGMVRQWQDLCHGNRHSQSEFECQPDFVLLAKAYGWTGAHCTKPQELEPALRAMIDTPGPYILDCRVSATENCYPMIPPGRAHNEMVLGADAA